MAWSPDGELLAMADWNSLVYIVDGTGDLIHMLSGNSRRASTVTWRPDSVVLATGGPDDRFINLWDAATGELLTQVASHINSLYEGVYDARWSSDGAYVLATSFDTFQFWETTNWQTVEPIRSGSLLDAEWSPDGTLLAVSDIYYLSFFNGQTLVSDDLDEDVIEIVGENPEQLSWSTDSQLVATTDRLDPRISIWHVPTRTRIGVFNTTGARFMDVAFIGNDRVAAISETGMLYLLNTTGAVITTYDTGVTDARTIAWNPQSGIIAVAGAHTQINASGMSGLPLLPLATILNATPAPTHTLMFTPTPTDTPTPTSTPTRTPPPTPTPIPLQAEDTKLSRCEPTSSNIY